LRLEQASGCTTYQRRVLRRRDKQGGRFG
jgi:hypothetical protein